MNFGDWFDPRDIDHVKAIKVYKELGKFPPWFKDQMEKEQVQLEEAGAQIPHWKMHALTAMADAWIENFLENS
jgi:hypothetical protein